MNVIRDIDIKDLKEVFKRQIDLSVKKELTNVRINYVTALRILDVLEETQIREERHQTLESACTFMEDGTQTNEMELHNKTDADGNILIDIEPYEKIAKMVERLQKVNAVIPECFGTFSCNKNLDKCFRCELTKECAIKSEGCTVAKDEIEKEGQVCLEPACYGFYKGEEKCSKCKSREYCESVTEEERIRDEDWMISYNGKKNN